MPIKFNNIDIGSF